MSDAEVPRQSQVLPKDIDIILRNTTTPQDSASEESQESDEASIDTQMCQGGKQHTPNTQI